MIGAGVAKRRSVTRPLAYLDRRGVQSFRRLFGPRYPPYLFLALLFGFFSFIGFVALGFAMLPPFPMAIAIVAGGGTGLLLIFADGSLMPIAADAPAVELVAFRRRVRLAGLLLVGGMLAILATYFDGGTPFFYAAGAFLFLGFAISSAWVFVSANALACRSCGLVTLFRPYHGRLVCTRCGREPPR